MFGVLRVGMESWTGAWEAHEVTADSTSPLHSRRENYASRLLVQWLRRFGKDVYRQTRLFSYIYVLSHTSPTHTMDNNLPSLSLLVGTPPPTDNI